MSQYLTINSNHNLEYFPDNQSYRFKTYFQAPLSLKGVWKVALVDLYMAEPNMKFRYNLYLYCDACDGYIVDGENENLLRMVKSTKAANWTQSFNNPQYLPVNKSELRELEIYIKDMKGNFATFLKKPVSLTLHFKSYPFYE